MVDLDTHRARIGCFHPSSNRLRNHKQDVGNPIPYILLGILLVFCIGALYPSPTVSLNLRVEDTLLSSVHQGTSSINCTLTVPLNTTGTVINTYVIPHQLLTCGDILPNPGPNYKFPCGVCSKPVKSNQKGIQCETCDKWYHTKCHKPCHKPTILTESYGKIPVTTTTHHKTEIPGRGVKIAHLNIRSILANHDNLITVINELNPDILAITETWLDNQIGPEEVDIHGYNFLRSIQTTRSI